MGKDGPGVWVSNSQPRSKGKNNVNSSLFDGIHLDGHIVNRIIVSNPPSCTQRDTQGTHSYQRVVPVPKTHYECNHETS